MSLPSSLMTPPSSSPARRRRLIAVTCALAASFGTLGATTADATPAPAAASAVAGTSLATLATTHAGLARLAAAGTPNGRGIAEFAAVPTTAQVRALRGLGLRVQPMRKLPMAIVSGTVAQLTAAVSTGVARDVYPDESNEYFDTDSSNAMSSTKAAGVKLRAKGFTGKGVTVGVVDSGCDGTHPDLADHVTHNVKLVSPEYANAGTGPMLVAPVDMGPYSNSDIGGGHGTHVAGIIGADGHTSKGHIGVAPDAKLACFSIGEGLFTTAVVTAYDYILSKPKLLGIKVINNSWGNSYRQFDPHDPVAVATKKVADKGVTVVFAAGNSGSGDVSMSLNPFSQSPWVISVAAGTVDRIRGDFSSNGLVYDNSLATAFGSGDHTVYTGDRIGVVHPDVTSPGVDISSTCDTIGTVIGPCAPGMNAEASGTSMASPHIAGAAAVLLQAQPKLTPTQVRLALQATATPVQRSEDDKSKAPFWEIGYGFVNLDKAVALVRSADWKQQLKAKSARADARVLRSDGVQVTRGDFFFYQPLPATVGGLDSASYAVPVAGGTQQLQVSLAFPSAGSVGISAYDYVVDVKDPSGRTVATTTTDALGGSGTATALVDLAKLHLGAGTYTFDIAGTYAASDPDTVDSDSVQGRFVTLHVAQLRKG